MSAVTTSFPNTAAAWDLPSRGKVAMAGLIIAESAIFTIFVVAYLFYLGKSIAGPTPLRSARDADLLHDLLIIEQLDHSPCGEGLWSGTTRDYSSPFGC